MKKLLFALCLLPGIAVAQHSFFGANQACSMSGSNPLVKPLTADAADSAAVIITGGGADATDGSRGARLVVGGNEYTAADGDILLMGGNTGNGGGVRVITNASGVAAYNWNFPRSGGGSATVSDLTFGTSGSTSVATIRSERADGADVGTLQLTAGGSSTLAASRGPYVKMTGDDLGGAGAGGNMLIAAGVGTLGTVDLATGSDLVRFSLEADGDLAQNATNGGNLIFQKDGTGIVESTESLAATGSDLAGAAQVTAWVVFVTGANGTAGIKLPAAAIVGQMVHIYNTANAVLKVYPGSGDQINAAGASTAVSVAAYAGLVCHASAADRWWCMEGAAA